MATGVQENDEPAARVGDAPNAVTVQPRNGMAHDP
jgi:hypothetical protein